MSEQSRNILARYENKFFITDDYGKQGVFFTNYDKRIILKWMALFRNSKFSTIIYDEPQRIEFNWHPEYRALMESEPAPVKLPKAVTLSKEHKLDLDKFMSYITERGYDIDFVTREVYEKENPRKQPFMRPKRKRI